MTLDYFKQKNGQYMPHIFVQVKASGENFCLNSGVNQDILQNKFL